MKKLLKDDGLCPSAESFDTFTNDEQHIHQKQPCTQMHAHLNPLTEAEQQIFTQ